MFIVLWVLVGFFAGLLTGKLMKANVFGSVSEMLTGIAGAMIGGFIMRGLGFSVGEGFLYAVVVACFSGMLLTFAFRTFLGMKNSEA